MNLSSDEVLRIAHFLSELGALSRKTGVTISSYVGEIQISVDDEELSAMAMACWSQDRGYEMRDVAR